MFTYDELFGLDFTLFYYKVAWFCRTYFWNSKI